MKDLPKGPRYSLARGITAVVELGHCPILAAILSLAACASGPSAPTPPPPPPPQPPTPLPIAWGWPVSPEDRSRLTGVFGEFLPNNNNAKYHAGIDIGPGQAGGTDVVTTAAGDVVLVQLNDVGCNSNVAGACADHGLGNTVLVRHLDASGSRFSQYSHLDSVEPAILSGCTAQRSDPPTRYHCVVPVPRLAHDPIGKMGNTNFGTKGPIPIHLHFEIKRLLGIGVDGKDDSSLGYGHSPTFPRPNQDLFDPVLLFHSASQISAPLTVIAPSFLRLGPLVGYPQFGALLPSDSPYEVLARVSNTSCSTEWALVRRVDLANFSYVGADATFLQAFSEFADGWVCPTDTVPRPAGLYAVGAPGQFAPSDLYLVDPAPSGIDTRIGTVRTQSGPTPTLYDIAEAPNGLLYGVGNNNRLFRLNPTDATAVDVGAAGAAAAGFVNALAFDPTGRLYGITAAGDVLRLQLFSGTAALVGNLGPGYGSSGDLVFFARNDIRAVASQIGSPDVLVRLDGGNQFRATPLQAGRDLGIQGVWGLQLRGNVLYGMSAAQSGLSPGLLLAIDAQGRATVIRPLAFPAYGASPPTGHLSPFRSRQIHPPVAH